MEMEGSTREQETAAPAAPRPPALPWTVWLQVFGLVAATDIAQRSDGTVNRFVFSLADRQARASARPDRSGVRSADVDVDASRGLWARVFSQPTADPAAPPPPVVVYFHGGGFALLSAASGPYDALCRRLCRELGAVVVSVNYRLAPEHRYPAAYDDGVDVLRHLGGSPGVGVPVDLSRCFLAGDSAGGNIIHHVAQRWTAASGSGPGPVRITGLVLLQPYFGGEERTAAERRLEGVAPVVNLRRSDWSWRAFLPEGADRQGIPTPANSRKAAGAAAKPRGRGGRSQDDLPQLVAALVDGGHLGRSRHRRPRRDLPLRRQGEIQRLPLP